MYCVMYEFIVEAKQEETFKHLWHKLTLKIKEDKGSLGSRLHKALEVANTWVAYGQWISQDAYNNSTIDKDFEIIREQFLKTISSIKILYELDVTDDLLGNFNFLIN